MPEQVILIAIMGATGSGKSSFIETVTGDRKVAIGHGLESETDKVTPYSVAINSEQFVLIDTPGFDDTYLSDMEILDKLADWLEDYYLQKRLLTGILYLHSIKSNKMPGSARRSMVMFKRLCGKDAYSNVVLGTTFWDLVDERTGIQRTNELIQNSGFWGEMVQNDSRVERMSRNRADCQSLLLQMARRSSATMLKIQKEMGQQGKALAQTSAGLFIDEEVAHLRAQQAAELAKADRLGKARLLDKEKEIRELSEQQDAYAEIALVELEMRNRVARGNMMREQQEMHDRRLRREEAAIRTERSTWEAKKVYAQMKRLKRMAQRGVIPYTPGSRYVRWCDCCLEVIGYQPFYGCVSCFEHNTPFDLCRYCFEAGHHCQQEHTEYDEKQEPPTIAFQPESMVRCDRCGRECSGIFMHCKVRDNYDLCVHCYIYQHERSDFNMEYGIWLPDSQRGCGPTELCIEPQSIECFEGRRGTLLRVER